MPFLFWQKSFMESINHDSSKSSSSEESTTVIQQPRWDVLFEIMYSKLIWVYNSSISNSPKLLDKNAKDAAAQGVSLKLKKTRHKRGRIFAATLQVEVNPV